MRLLAAIGFAALLISCAPEPPSDEVRPRQPAPPIGATAYREILLREAQLDWTPERLARAAHAEACFVRARMDAIAARLGDADGLAAFARLSQDHPATASGTLDIYRASVDRARRFVLDHNLVTIPPGPPLEVVETPTVLPEGRYPFVAYLGDKLAVTDPLSAAHCRVCVTPLVAHEAYPGHHVAFLVRRQPKSPPDPELFALANRHAKNRFHSEGWAQYGEILMLESGFYAGDPAGELAAWRLVLMRLLRAELDAELHAGAIDGETLVERLATEAGVAPATARAELDHHLEEPTMKASYFVGLLQILALRAELERRAGEKDFDRRAFHDRLLEWPLPWPEIARRLFGVEALTVPDSGEALARLFGEHGARGERL